MQLSGHLLPSETNQVGTRDHGEIIEDEYSQMEIRASIADSNCCWYDWPENVTEERGSTARTPANPQEKEWVEAASATLSWLNTSGDPLPMNIDGKCGKDGDLGGAVVGCLYGLRASVGGLHAGPRLVLV